MVFLQIGHHILDGAGFGCGDLDKYGLLSVRDLTAFLLGLVVSLLTLSLCNAIYGKTLKPRHKL